MKIELPTGVILESDNAEIIECWLNNGGKEIKPEKKSKK